MQHTLNVICRRL